MIHQRVERFPDRDRNHHRNANGHDGRQKTAADLATIEPHHGIDAPHLQQRDDGEPRNDPRRDAA